MTHAPRLAAGLALLLGLSLSSANAGDTVILSDGEITVTRADLDAAKASLNHQQRRGLREQPEQAEALAKRIFFRRAIARDAEADGLADDPRAALIIRQREESLLSRARLDQVQREAVADESIGRLAREHYQANRREFRTEDEVEARHILFSTAEADADEALAAAQSLRDRLAAGEIDFADAAREYSDDPGSGGRGGELGRFGRGRMVGPFEDAVFSLEPGELSDPVETQFGYHLIEVQTAHPARQLDFEEVEDQIRASLGQRLRQNARSGHIAEVRRNEEVAVNWELVERMQERLSGDAGDR